MRVPGRSLLVVCVFAALCGCGAANTGFQAPPTCGPGGQCANGLLCAWDNHCYAPGQAPRNPNVPDLSAIPPDLTMMCTQATCAAPTPICDGDSGQCVACLQDVHCPDGRICKMKQCVPGCTAQKGCGDAGTCDPNSGTCGGCASDASCADPKSPRCDPMSGACVPCLPQGDNCAQGSFCQKVNGAWQCAQGCKVDNDCTPPPLADGGVAPHLACCNHVCTDLNGDSANCGQCGQACRGQSCCGAACVDPARDLANCGGCGKACGGGHANWQCLNSACTVNSCVAPYQDCNKDPSDGCEANTATDPNNCTGCGNACVIPNGVPGCGNQGCVVQSCMPGYADCDHNIANGCEVHVAVDTGNCGSCGNTCGATPNATPACINGMCGIGMCSKGYGDCDLLPGDGCEVNLGNDVGNCNGCGVACPQPAHANVSCSAGACVIGCIGSFRDCNNNLMDGCEANVSNDPKNCNVCGRACPAPQNAAASCVAGACGLGACVMGFKDCNGNPGDGCEVDINGDGANCGGCGNACPAVTNGMGGCSNGQCVIGSCNQGYGDCDGSFNNGCEANLNTDKSNCSRCGNSCPNNAPNCSNGQCVNATLHWKQVEGSACNAWCGGQGGVFACANSWTCDMVHVNGFVWLYSQPGQAPPLTINVQAYGWVSWYCGVGGCHGPGPQVSTCNGGGPYSVWQCVFE